MKHKALTVIKASTLEWIKVQQRLSGNIYFCDNLDTKTKFKVYCSQSQGCIFYFILLIFYFISVLRNGQSLTFLKMRYCFSSVYIKCKDQRKIHVISKRRVLWYMETETENWSRNQVSYTRGLHIHSLFLLLCPFFSDSFLYSLPATRILYGLSLLFLHNFAFEMALVGTLSTSAPPLPIR